jgi:predicted MFS family arabinose efflux permease
MIRSTSNVNHMTLTNISQTSASTSPSPARPHLITKPLLLRFVSVIGSSASFYLMLSVVPLYAKASGGGAGAAGLATGTLMAATVAGEMATPRLVNRIGYRSTLITGLVLLGTPALMLTLSGDIAWIITVCLIRGLGFALTVVAGGALSASLIPADRRGEGLALLGVVSGVPSLVGLPLGIWLAAHTGYTSVSIAAAAVALVAIVSVPGLPDREPSSGPETGIVAGLRNPTLMRPTIIFASTALTAGILVTFLPLAVSATSTGLVTTALFAQPLAATVARWFAGRHGDRHGPSRLLLPSLLTAAAGVFITALTNSATAVVIGVTIFGIGFGIAQNSTLSLMYTRVPRSDFGMISALWNTAYDAAMGIGAISFGWVSAATGYPTAFALTGAVMLTALIAIQRDHQANLD